LEEDVGELGFVEEWFRVVWRVSSHFRLLLSVFYFWGWFGWSESSVCVLLFVYVFSDEFVYRPNVVENCLIT